jgi:2-hydroxychromene-2-carboxylate isomerase
VKVSWVFDVISPFSYLCFKELHRLPQNAELEFVPVLFAALLNHHGQIGNAEIASKRRFTYRLCLWRARKLGIPLRLPPAHPFNPLLALRAIVAAGSTRRVVEQVFDAVWLQGRDVANAAVIDELARECGIANPQETLNDPAVKQKLRDTTQWAIAKGTFGVPTFVIDDELFWGHETVDMVADYLRDPAGFDDAGMRAIDTLPVGVVRERPS